MSTELKPCPYCGSDSDVVMRESEPSNARYNEGAVHFAVACLRLGCGMMPTGYVWHVNPEDAAKAWNTRADGWISVDDKLPAIGEAMRYSMCLAVHYQWDSFPRILMFDNVDKVFTVDGDAPQKVTHWMQLPSLPRTK